MIFSLFSQIRSGIYQVILLVVCLILIQGVFLFEAHGQGATDFQNYLNTLIGVLSKNQPVPEIPSETPPNSLSTLITSISATQKNTASTQQSSFTPYNTPEHTSEILLPLYFNPLPENESLLPSAESYTITVCLPYNGLFPSGCAVKKTPSQASEILASSILNHYFKSTSVRPFKISMPSSMPLDQQALNLRQIELMSISIIESAILKEGTQRNRNILQENMKIARQDAESGVNWSRHVNNDITTCNFHSGKTIKDILNFNVSER